MNIQVASSGNIYTVTLDGRLDTTTAPELENALKAFLKKASAIIFDFAGLEYISSAGLRVLLASQKELNGVGGTMTIQNANDSVREVFDITGMVNVFDLK